MNATEPPIDPRSDEWIEAEVAVAFAEARPTEVPTEILGRTRDAVASAKTNSGVQRSIQGVRSTGQDRSTERDRSRGMTRWLAFASAAGVAGLMFAAGYWTGRTSEWADGPGPVVPVTDDGARTGTPLVSSDSWDEWIGRPEIRVSDLAVTDDAGSSFESARGSVAWDEQRQTGYLRLVGLPKNDPAQSQYQLWIIDASRGDLPVDGGVFDVNSEDAVVAIDAKLWVPEAKVFAITREPPGGVVVSDGPLLLTASL